MLMTGRSFAGNPSSHSGKALFFLQRAYKAKLQRIIVSCGARDHATVNATLL